ncbi:MAG: hypothetical protein E6J26_07485 [Chloroflexi bacterium]|nr:MAG: hypothetical protein E6J26_07485 [Chloroflexota bacterium]
MSLIDRKQIEAGVLNMFKANMGLQPGEKILVVSDPPALANWSSLDSAELERMVERCLLAKTVAEIAAEHFKQNTVDFYAYPAVARSGAEPEPELGRRMAAADVVIAITNRSLSHTDARQDACRAGARIASMPGFAVRMFFADGPMSADYQEVDRITQPVARRLSEAHEAVVRSPAGTDIRVRLDGRKAIADNGLFVHKGDFGNLPAGEGFIAPVEGSAEGQLVVEPGWARGLSEKMTLRFQQGWVLTAETSSRSDATWPSWAWARIPKRARPKVFSKRKKFWERCTSPSATTRTSAAPSRQTCTWTSCCRTPCSSSTDRRSWPTANC